MKTFDFTKARETHHKEVVDFWYDYKDKKIGVSFYIIALKKIRSNWIGAKCRTPARLKREYLYLKEEFGFFM